MLIKAKPTSPGMRGTVRLKNPQLYTGRPYRPLVEAKTRVSGRNNRGHITVRHRGGGARRLYRVIDFRRDKDGIPALVERIEYDPNRSAHIALLRYRDGERRYVVCPQEVKSGDSLQSGTGAPVRPGNCMPLQDVPLGSVVHCVELKPGKGAQLARSAGAGVQLIAREGAYATLRLRSGEVRNVPVRCRATLGTVSNSGHSLRALGKAGTKRRLGVRPTVRGVAMNPVDHPHGGGEGRTSGGRHPCTPWGYPTKGYRTRKNKRSDALILRRRSTRRGRRSR